MSVVMKLVRGDLGKTMCRIYDEGVLTVDLSVGSMFLSDLAETTMIMCSRPERREAWLLTHRCVGGKRGPDEVLGLFATPHAAATSELAKRLVASTRGYDMGGWLPSMVSVTPERPDPGVPEFSWNIDGEMERLTISRMEVQR